MARTARKTLAIYEDSVLLADDINSIDFTGATSGSVDMDGNLTQNFTGGGGSGVNFETPTGAIDGSNVTFTVAHTPKAIFLNGATYFENDGYTLSGLTITIASQLTPQTGSTLRSLY